MKGLDTDIVDTALGETNVSSSLGKDLFTFNIRMFVCAVVFLMVGSLIANWCKKRVENRRAKEKLEAIGAQGPYAKYSCTPPYEYYIAGFVGALFCTGLMLYINRNSVKSISLTTFRINSQVESIRNQLTALEVAKDITPSAFSSAASGLIR